MQPIDDRMTDEMERFVSRAEDLLSQIQAARTPPASTASTSAINVHGGGWTNTIAMIFMGGLALAMFVLFLAERESSHAELEAIKIQARTEREDLKAQVRMDVQRIESTLNRHAEKLETHDAYLNDIYRRTKEK